jgi:hypothetical protein
MAYLENSNQLVNYTKKGLIKICSINPDIFIAYNRINKEEVYYYIVKMLQNCAKIKLPLLDDDDVIKNNYKTCFCSSCSIKLSYRTDRGNKRNSIKGCKYCNDCFREFDIFQLY